MFCPKCGNQKTEGANFCRICGADLDNALLAPAKQRSIDKKSVGKCLMNNKSKDPDELTAAGIANVIIGDGFFMVAVLLSATHSSVSSLLWLFMLIPAFFFFGKGFADVLHGKQIRRRLKQSELEEEPKTAELMPHQVSIIDAIKRHASGELVPAPSVTEATTRDLR
jgi:hypothetical protein